MRSVFLMLMLLLVAACGPRYETRYRYTAPPDSPDSRQCLQSCEFQRQQCLVIEDNRYQLCTLQAANDAYRCQAEARYDYDRCLRYHDDQPERCHYQRGFCPQRACWRDDRHCGELYRSCYVACGGSVESETMCVANCDEAPADLLPAPSLSP